MFKGVVKHKYKHTFTSPFLIENIVEFRYNIITMNTEVFNMENNFISKAVTTLPELIKNTHININLNGWPATVSIVACCVSAVTIVAIKTSPQQVAPSEEGATCFYLYIPPINTHIYC